MTQRETAAATPVSSATRREFLKTSTSSALGTAALAGMAELAPVAYAASSDVLKIGLIGCGGRGTGAAAQALQADPHLQLTAMGDAFEDRLEQSLETLTRDKVAGPKVDVPRERRFVGFEAYRQVIDSGVDVVLLTSPPGFRPLHFKAAVEAGKHVFAEKPCAVDAPGVRSVLATAELAAQKGLAVVSGLCLRYHAGYRQALARIHDGAVGEIHTLLANDYRGPIWVKPRQPDWTDMHWQMRNWYYFTWLSGDFNVEQHVHHLDVCAWMMNGYPEKAVGMGGRQVRTGPEFGNIYDHHSVIYEYANGARLFSNTRQQAACANDMSCHVVGSKGNGYISERRLTVTGDEKWQYRAKPKDMYEVEHDELFASIRAGKPINNAEYMAKSTLLAIMGRMATYTGKTITWDQALNSKEDLTPAKYEWGPMPTPPIAMPGLTPFM